MGVLLGIKAVSLVLDQFSPGLGEGALAYRLAAMALRSLDHGRFWGVSKLAQASIAPYVIAEHAVGFHFFVVGICGFAVLCQPLLALLLL